MSATNRSTRSRRQSTLLIGGLLTALLFALGCHRELGVYTLCKYEGNWKGNVCPSEDKDPYYDFWKLMREGSNSTSATGGSRQLRNAAVNIKSVLPISDSVKHWDAFDMVFFYGHHNTIETPHGGTFDYSTYDGSTWTEHEGNLDTMGWGHDTPYDYWSDRPVTDADEHPAAVTYLYNQYTSTLTGGTRDYGGGVVTWREKWFSPKSFLPHDKLGSDDLEWLILDGCQAVITATPEGHYLSLGLKTFAPTHGAWHIVLGHYESYWVSQLQPMDGFAMDLRAGVPVQQAYFDTDPDTNSSAIAAEKPNFSWAKSTMINDTWTNQVADVKDASVFSQRWIVSLNFVDGIWGPP